jgi:polyphosphate kinase
MMMMMDLLAEPRSLRDEIEETIAAEIERQCEGAPACFRIDMVALAEALIQVHGRR